MSALHVELLTKARELIENTTPGKRRFICIALDEVDVSCSLLRAKIEIKDHIRLQLAPHGTALESWLRHEHGIDLGYYQLPLDVTEKLKTTRLAWIDWLIEEWRDAP